MTNFRRLKNVATIVACFAAALFFSAALVSCNKDDDNNGLSTSTVTSITASVEGGSDLNSLIDEVRLIAWTPDGEVVLATAKFIDSSFKIDLPETVPSNVLSSIERDYGTGVNVSNMNVKIAEASLRAFDEDGKRTGSFYYVKEDGNTLVGMELSYSDGDVNITGKLTDEYGTEIFSVSVKKGWNQIFYITKKVSEDVWEETYTTRSQSGLKWVFNEW